MCGCFAYMLVYHMHAWCLQRSEEDRSPGTGVRDGYELPCGWWELNPSLLKEQPVLLTSWAVSLASALVSVESPIIVLSEFY